MFDEDSPQFLPEGFRLVVLLLILDIFNQTVLLFDGVGERAISLLPAVEVFKEFLPLNDISCGELDVLDEIGQGHRRMKVGHDVEMILDSIDPVYVALVAFEYAGYVTEEYIAVIGRESPMPVPCAEDDLVDDLGISTHCFLEPRWGSRVQSAMVTQLESLRDSVARWGYAPLPEVTK